MNQTELNEVLKLHKKWLYDEPGGKKANLCGTDLRGATLYGADLREADLRGADLRGATLYGADLYGADLREATLCGANLRETDLRGTDLCEATLCGANLRGANLCGANLRETDLRETDLRRANLRGADLYGADLRETDLYQSVLPLWCDGLILQLDRLQMAQLAYHFCGMRCDDDEIQALQRSLYKYANEFADSRDGLKKFEEEENKDEDSDGHVW